MPTQAGKFITPLPYQFAEPSLSYPAPHLKTRTHICIYCNNFDRFSLPITRCPFTGALLRPTPPAAPEANEHEEVSTTYRLKVNIFGDITFVRENVGMIRREPECIRDAEGRVVVHPDMNEKRQKMVEDWIEKCADYECPGFPSCEEREGEGNSESGGSENENDQWDGIFEGWDGDGNERKDRVYEEYEYGDQR